MNTEVDKYHHAFRDLEVLMKTAAKISSNLHGRKVTSRNLDFGLTAFNKMIGHANAVLKVAPLGPFANDAPLAELWDISSMAALTRALIDAYYTLFYIAADEVPPEVGEFRWLLWDYHSRVRQLEMLELIKSKSSELSRIKQEIDDLKGKIRCHEQYLMQSNKMKKKILDGGLGIFATNSELSKKADIDSEYYRAVFMFLSSYTHAHPLSINQLRDFQAGSDDSLNTMSTLLGYNQAYASCAIRDIIRVFPDQADEVDEAAKFMVDAWVNVLREYSRVASQKYYQGE